MISGNYSLSQDFGTIYWDYCYVVSRMIYKFVLLLLISRYHYEFGNLVLGALAFVLICYLSILLINSLLYHN